MTELKGDALKGVVQKWLASTFHDPVAKTLLKNSHLTRTQLETFLIDVLAVKISGKAIGYERKSKLRLIDSGVSRGAFNRTLSQARQNIIKSIYTAILLGYLGVFESSCLDPYLEIANKLRTFTESYRGIRKNGRTSNEHMRVISTLHKEIEKTLQELSNPKALSNRT